MMATGYTIAGILLGTTLLLSKATRDALQSAAELKALPAQMVKGVALPVEVFTLAELAPG